MKFRSLALFVAIAGCSSPPGPQGPTGAPGERGEPGPPGSPDTGAQILEKIEEAGGIDSVGGIPANELVTRGLRSFSIPVHSLFLTNSATVDAYGVHLPPSGFSLASTSFVVPVDHASDVVNVDITFFNTFGSGACQAVISPDVAQHRSAAGSSLLEPVSSDFPPFPSDGYVYIHRYQLPNVGPSDSITFHVFRNGDVAEDTCTEDILVVAVNVVYET